MPPDVKLRAANAGRKGAAAAGKLMLSLIRQPRTGVVEKPWPAISAANWTKALPRDCATSPPTITWRTGELASSTMNKAQKGAV